MTYRHPSIRLATLLLIKLLLLAACTTGKDPTVLKAEIASNQSRLQELKREEQTLDKELQPHLRINSYLKSDQGQSFFQGTRCQRPVPSVFPHIPRPRDACASEIDVQRHIGGSCDISAKCNLVSALVGLDRVPKSMSYIANLGCALLDDSGDPLDDSINALTDTFCQVGVKQKKKIKFKLRGGWVGIGLWVGRGLACYKSTQRFRQNVDDLTQCIKNEDYSCRRRYTDWQNDLARRENAIAREKADIDAGFQNCKTQAAFMQKQGVADEIDNEGQLDVLRDRQDQLKLQVTETEQTIGTQKHKLKLLLDEIRIKNDEKKAREIKERDY